MSKSVDGYAHETVQCSLDSCVCTWIRAPLTCECVRHFSLARCLFLLLIYSCTKKLKDEVLSSEPYYVNCTKQRKRNETLIFVSQIVCNSIWYVKNNWIIRKSNGDCVQLYPIWIYAPNVFVPQCVESSCFFAFSMHSCIDFSPPRAHIQNCTLYRQCTVQAGTERVYWSPWCLKMRFAFIKWKWIN